MTQSIVVPRPSDYHVHLRQKDMMSAIAPYTGHVCGRCMVMPNTTPPIANASDLTAYWREVQNALQSPHCHAHMTIKFVPETTPETIITAFKAGAIAIKLYPAGMTTNAQDGIPKKWFEEPPPQFQDCLKTIEDLGVVLSMHGEMPGYPVFHSPHKRFCVLPGEGDDRTGAFLRWITNSLIPKYPNIKMVLEHITTQTEVSLICKLRNRGVKIAGTITPHHLCTTIEDLVGDKLKPHLFCKPLAKYEEDMRALQNIILQGHPGFFLGSDTAPHQVETKECEECCAGVFNASVMVEFLTQFFVQNNKEELLADFIAHHGDQFYGLPRQKETITVKRRNWMVPRRITWGAVAVVPFLAGHVLKWDVDL